MTLSPAAVVRDAWALARRDGGVLAAIAGPFWFLPAYATGLLLPRPPLLSPEANERAQAVALTPWVQAVAPWYLLQVAVGLWGTATVLALYLDRTQPDVGAALRRGLSLWLRLALAHGAVLVAATAVAFILRGIAGGAGLLLCVPALLLLLGRTMPIGPALMAERPLGAIAAVARALRLTRGRGLPLAGVVAGIWGAGLLANQPLMAIDGWLRGLEGGNPVALAIVDAASAAISAAVALAMTLAAVAAYRRLVR